MTINDLICVCLGLGMNDTAWLDRFCDNFNIDFGEEEIHEWLDLCSGDYSGFGNLMIGELCRMVADEAKSRAGIEAGTEESDAFDEAFFYDVNASATNIGFNGESVYDSDGFDAAVEAWQAERNGGNDEEGENEEPEEFDESTKKSMKKMNENTKVTLTLGQLKRLVKEATDEDDRMAAVNTDEVEVPYPYDRWYEIADIDDDMIDGTRILAKLRLKSRFENCAEYENAVLTDDPETPVCMLTDGGLVPVEVHELMDKTDKLPKMNQKIAGKLFRHGF